MSAVEVAAALAQFGLIPRGGFVFEAGDDAPTGPSGQPARSVLLVGHGGGTIWPHFSRWLAERTDRPTDPLDTWSKEVLSGIAGKFAARAVFPSDRPYLPFQKWAMRAEGLRPSPLGILMHPRYGLWHAYRGALLFDAGIAVDEAGAALHLCDPCEGKDCINACPASAVSAAGVDVQQCRDFLASEAGAGCVTGGCAARAACPHDRYAYGPGQIAFHMAAYTRSIIRR